MRSKNNQLTLLRHGEAEAHSQRGDHGRRLTRQGQQQARDVGHWLRRQAWLPDLLLCSDSKRTRETAEILLAELRQAVELKYESALYLAEPEQLLAELWALDDGDQRVLVLGHNPGLSRLAAELAGDLSTPFLPTAGLAQFEVPACWAHVGSQASRLLRLRWSGQK